MYARPATGPGAFEIKEPTEPMTLTVACKSINMHAPVATALVNLNLSYSKLNKLL